MVWRICGSYEADYELRRDLHQETLLAVWRALPRFRGASNLRTYIARIAHNRAIAHVSIETRRPLARELQDDLVQEGKSPEDLAASAVLTEKLQLAIRSLPLDQRQPVTLTMEGFNPKEIADVLGISANAVSIRLTRAKSALKDMFKDDPHERD